LDFNIPKSTTVFYTHFPPDMALDGGVHETVAKDDRLALIKGVWQLGTTEDKLTSQELETYFHYYTTECKNALSQGGDHTTVRNHEDVVAIAKSLEDGLTKKEIQIPLLQLDTKNRSNKVKDQMAIGSIRLVVRLMLMVDIGPIPDTCIQGRAHLEWQDEGTKLKEFFENHFVESCVLPGNVKFGSEFTAYNIHRYAGLDIQWTVNLYDHLRLIEDETVLCIFHHATFLKWQNRSDAFFLIISNHSPVLAPFTPADL
jgi:hypothetical protein